MCKFVNRNLLVQSYSYYGVRSDRNTDRTTGAGNPWLFTIYIYSSDTVTDMQSRILHFACDAS